MSWSPRYSDFVKGLNVAEELKKGEKYRAQDVEVANLWHYLKSSKIGQDLIREYVQCAYGIGACPRGRPSMPPEYMPSPSVASARAERKAAYAERYRLCKLSPRECKTNKACYLTEGKGPQGQQCRKKPRYEERKGKMTKKEWAEYCAAIEERGDCDKDPICTWSVGKTGSRVGVDRCERARRLPKSPKKEFNCRSPRLAFNKNACLDAIAQGKACKWTRSGCLNTRE